MSSPRWWQELKRADFLRSVGLYVMENRLVLVRLRKSFLNVAVVEDEVRELTVPDDRQAISELTGWVADDVREIALKAETDSRDRELPGDRILSAVYQRSQGWVAHMR